MLTKADDYPIHQTPEPIVYSGNNRNFYDRYFFNGYQRRGGCFFAAALGVYPHLNVLDAAFSVIKNGIQHNLFASRRLHMERLDTRVGPIAVQVVEPLNVLTLTVADEERDIHADLTFQARFPAIEEPRFVRRAGAMTVMDYTRLTQNGSWSGTISLDGESISITPDSWWGTRDRSWGIRPVGMRDPQPNPEAGEPQFFWLWAPINFEDRATFYHLNAEADGRPWNTAGRIVDAAGVLEPQVVSSRLEYASGTRHARIAEITLGDAHIRLKPRQTFFMKGIGYGHPEWSHGLYHGELETGFERYELSTLDLADPTHFHIQAICDATLSMADGSEQEGRGILEQMVIGPYSPYGFTSLADTAP